MVSNAPDCYQVINNLSNNQYLESEHTPLKSLWYSAQYEKWSAQNPGVPLTKFQKRVIRRKNPPPVQVWCKAPTIPLSAGEIRNIIRESYERNPILSVEEKRRLALATGKPTTFISHWFRNQRCADKRKAAK